MLPARCAWRSSSLANASNTPNVVGESFRANQIGVVVSRFVISTPAARKSATACSLPGLASSRTNNPHLIVIFILHSVIYEGLQSRRKPTREAARLGVAGLPISISIRPYEPLLSADLLRI